MPVYGDLGDADAGHGADDGAVQGDDGGGRRRLGEHEHLDVEDPALGVHVGHDVGQGAAREELEAALGVVDARGGGRGEDLDDGVEGLHEEVAQGRALDDGVAADEVAPAADGDAAAAGVDDVLAALDQLAQVREARGAVRVGEEDVGAPGVAEAVRHAAALAAVLDEGDDAQDVVEALLAGEFEGHVDGAVGAAVVDDQNLVARDRGLAAVLLGALPEDLAVVLRRGADGAALLLVLLRLAAGWAAEARVEILDGLLESRYDAVLLVVGGDDDGDLDLGRLDGTGVGDAEGCVASGGRLAQLALGVPAIVPAGQGTRLADAAVGLGGYVGLLGGEGISRLGRDDVEDEEDLRWCVLSAQQSFFFILSRRRNVGSVGNWQLLLSPFELNKVKSLVDLGFQMLRPS